MSTQKNIHSPTENGKFVSKYLVQSLMVMFDSTGIPNKKHRSETQLVDEDECPSAETDAAVDEQTPPTTTVSSVDMCYYCFDVLKARLYNQPAPSAPTFTNEPL